MMNIARLLSFLLRLSKEIPHARLRIFFIAVAGIVGGVASTSMIALVTEILTKRGDRTALLAGLFIALCVALPIFRFVSQLLLIDLAQKSLLAFRLRLAKNILGAPLRHLETVGPHKLLATLTGDITTIVEALTAIPLLVMHVAVVVSCLVYLGWLNWVVLLEIVGFIVLGVVTYQIPVLRAIRHFMKSREIFNDLTKDVRSLTEGTKELKMHRRRRWDFLRRIDHTAERFRLENRAGYVVFTAASSWGQALFFVVLGLLVLLLPRFQPMDSRTLIGFTVILFQMMVPLEVLMNALPTLGRALASAQAVEEMGFSLEAETKEKEGTGDLPADGNWGSLELAGVTHRYRRENEEESFLLGPIDLSFEPGELVFLVGGNGSGKTTLAKLVLGLYVPESGEVRMGGRTVDDSNREEYREHFSAVFSDFFVFETLLGLDADALDDEARKYLTKLHLQQKVQVKDGALSTIDLSQGQRKRLALLTAYLEDRPIYLFDEWAADQDPIFKEIFYLELLPELKSRGKTVFVISHDDHYFHVADRVLKLDYGKIEADLTVEAFLDAHKPVGVRAAG
jgi:putative pyoverdin transport system ATP-binding/permease protein